MAVSSKIPLYGSCHQICCCFVIFILGVEAVVNFGVVVAVADAVILAVLTAAGVIVVVAVAVSGVIILAVVTAAGVIVVV